MSVNIVDIATPVSFEQFDTADALSLGLHMLQLARSRNLVVSIGIDMGEQIVFRAALPGTNADYQYWIERKLATVKRFGRSSLSLELQLTTEPDFAKERALSSSEYVLVGGAVPITIGPTLVGVVAVAGLASSDDHALVVEALTTFQRDA